MSTSFLEPYVNAPSPVHRLDARIKVVVALLAILAINLTPARAWPALVGYGLLVGAALAMARVGAGVALRRSLVALPFALMAAVNLPFLREGTAVARFSLLGWEVSITDVGLWRFGAVMARSWLSLLAAAALTLTTRFPEIIRALRFFRVPLVLVAVLSLMYRYLFVLVEEAQRLMRARDARSGWGEGGRGGGLPRSAASRTALRHLAWRARVTGSMVGTLFLRTYERSERIYQAMLARGYDGQVRVLQPARLTGAQVAAAGAMVAALGVVLVLAHCWW